jgi:hypothetical protein
MSDNPISAPEAPQHHLATHPITLELTKRGVTEKQLAAIRFRGGNRELSFDQWSFTWGNGIQRRPRLFEQIFRIDKWNVCRG